MLLLVSLLVLLIHDASSQTNHTFRFAKSHGDNMVLQRHPATPSVWGFGMPGRRVRVSVVGKERKITRVGSNGIWQVFLNSHPADHKTYTINANDGRNTISMTNVVFGDVYFCSGQSNMQYTVKASFNGSVEIANAYKYPFIRFFAVKRSYTDNTPKIDTNPLLPWSVPSNSTVASKSDPSWSYISATCWYFGRTLYDDIQIPIGLIDDCFGNTAIDVWMSPQAYKKCGPNPPMNSSTKPDPKESDTNPPGSQPAPTTPSMLYNNMVYAWHRTTIRGVIWYQGETDSAQTGRTLYGCRQSAMLNDWRQLWHQYSKTNVNFPFGFVMLSTWADSMEQSCGNNIDSFPCNVGDLRWQQTCSKGHVPNNCLTNTFLVTAYDYGDPNNVVDGDIHPRFKLAIGQRLSTAAKNVIYGEQAYWQGPYATKVSMSKSNELMIEFTNTGKFGLMMKNSNGFEVERGQQWMSVPLKSVDKTHAYLSVNGDDVDCVRYLWSNAPCSPSKGVGNCPIYGKQSLDVSAIGQLPALPFIMNVSAGGCSKYTGW